MIPCAFCERPLTCDGCGVELVVVDPEVYAALHRAESPIVCPACEKLLVCRYCKTTYRGDATDDDDD